MGIRSLVLSAGLLSGTGLAMPALARQAAGAEEVVPEIPEFPVSRFVAVYDREMPGLPDLAGVLDDVRVKLSRTSEGFVSPGADPGEYTWAELNDSAAGAARYSRGALEAVNRAIVRALNARGLLGVLVATDSGDIEIDVREASAPLSAGANLWVDRRGAGDTAMGIKVYTARVVQVRTVASGDRIDTTKAVDHPAHASIRERSPVMPQVDGSATGRDVLRKDLIDDYTFRLNRAPGRRVDVAVSLADQPGDVVLDYLVRENRPWFLFAQVANNGTRQTEEVRERFGFIHNQLTGHDDQLVIDFVTGGFQDTYGLVGSYEFPVTDRITLRPFATYSKFDASQVGQGDEGFEGESWSAGLDSTWNFFQHRELFLDLVGGVRWEHIAVDNRTVGVSGDDSFLIPSLGVRLERSTDESSTHAYLRGETNLASIAATGDPDLEKLGRTDPDAEWFALLWGAEHSFYLEPLLDSTRFKNGRSTLAHEIAVRFRAQNTFGARLAPTFQDVAGGMDSVRGYPESAVAGDDIYVGSFEYRLHIPRLLGPYDETGGTPPTVFGQPFRLRPQTRYSRPDWDLIVKGFVDAGRSVNHDRLPFESNETLIGAGYGFEVLIGKNLSLRLDWGVALSEVDEPTRVTPGSSRVHFVVTVIF